jgi:predicted RNA-binding protein with PUA-like domain
MRYWLMKSEPEVYPLAQLRKDGRAGWTCVRNYQARNFMRDDMRIGDGVLFYHSNANPAAAVGLAKVCGGPLPDPTQFDPKDEHFDPKSKRESPTWMMVEVEFVETFKTPVSLAELKQTAGLEKMALTQRGSRLSIQPVTPAEWKIVLALGRRAARD